MSYFIVYPGGDRSKLAIINLSDYMKYELSDYAVASRHEWDDDNEQEAITYAKHLAKENNKEYIGDEDGYLD